MPMPLAAKAGVIAISVAVAAAIAVYESPEIRRMADDLRRRIAIALQSLGDNIAPNDDGTENAEPIFNRPEDAEGFLLSRGGSGDPDVVADEETRRRQRQELLYWNSIRLENMKKSEEEQTRDAIAAVEKATREAAEAAGLHSLPGVPATTFDQLLGKQDKMPNQDTTIVNTGADYGSEDPLQGGLVRRRGGDGMRGLQSFIYANPFSDEYGIELEDQQDLRDSVNSNNNNNTAASKNLMADSHMSPDSDEILSDIYNATEPDTGVVASGQPVKKEVSDVNGVRPMQASEVFFDATDPIHTAETASTATIEGEQASSSSNAELLKMWLSNNHPGNSQSTPSNTNNIINNNNNNNNNNFATNGVNNSTETLDDAYSSIQAWAQNSTASGFYSPLPVTPMAPLSEPEVISTGDLTPTDSMSIVGETDGVSARGVGSNSSNGHQSAAASAPASSAPSLVDDTASQTYDVMSDDDDGETSGMMTPTSWAEVASVASESDVGVPAGQVHA